MASIKEILSSASARPATFEDYLNCYADQVGDLVNEFIPRGSHGDMDAYLYDPLLAYSRNGGNLLCSVPGRRWRPRPRHERGGGHRALPHGGAHP